MSSRTESLARAEISLYQSVQEIKEPYSAPANFRAPEVEAVRDPATRKLTDFEAL